MNRACKLRMLTPKAIVYFVQSVIRKIPTRNWIDIFSDIYVAPKYLHLFPMHYVMRYCVSHAKTVAKKNSKRWSVDNDI